MEGPEQPEQILRQSPPRRGSSTEWPDPLPHYDSTLHFFPTDDESAEQKNGHLNIHPHHVGDDYEFSYDGFTRLKERRESTEILSPAHHCPTRKSTLLVATFNLVATIVGGGVLSLPLAFEKSGVVLGTAMMIFAAVITDFSLYMLCSCARRTGASSYVEVCLVAFGPGLELFTTVLLFVFLLFVIVAYMVLVRDIWTPILLLLFKSIFGGRDSADSEDAYGDAVLLFIVLLMSPFLLQTNLHALRFNCYVGFVSISVLCGAIVYRAWEKNAHIAINEVHESGTDIKLFTSSFADALYAFPIITLSFMSSFNMLSVHGALIDPTRKRIRYVIDGAVGACFALTYVFGLAGYLYAADATQGNILLNFNFRDMVILAGRVGCGVTIMLAMAMVTLPCRESLLAVGPMYGSWRRSETRTGHGGEDELLEIARGKESLPQDAPAGQFPTHQKECIEGASVTEGTPLVTKPAREASVGGHEDNERFVKVRDNLVHFGSTFVIVSACYFGAVAAPGVAIVWSICGSSMAFIISFILPAACYIKVRATRKGHWNQRVLACWLLLAFSVVGSVACTAQTVLRMMSVEVAR